MRAVEAQASLKRLITQHPSTAFPDWALKGNRESLAPFAIVGGWQDVDPDAKSPLRDVLQFAPPPIDRLVVAELTGHKAPEIATAVTTWQRDTEPLFLRFGDEVMITSREDAWFLLGGHISKTYFQKFFEFAPLLLEEIDPSLSLPPDKRWAASIFGKADSTSELLRKSIVDSLALISCYPTADAIDPSVNLVSSVRKVLDQSLPLQAPWQRWASIGRNLLSFAEIDPEWLIDRIERDLESDTPATPDLFKEYRNNPLFGRMLHCDLLWALEILAWSPAFLPRVAIILAKLHGALPAGHNCGNSPEHTFREIFLAWRWHTCAGAEERIGALRHMLEGSPEHGWRMILEVFPGNTLGVSQGTEFPRWRPWADGWAVPTGPERTEYTIKLGELVINAAGDCCDRWADLLPGILYPSKSLRNQALEKLEDLAAVEDTSMATSFQLWAKIRELTAKHLRHPGAKWRFDDSTLSRLQSLANSLEPKDAVLKSTWLFEHSVELLEPSILQGVAAHDSALYDRRVAVIRQIAEEHGPEGVLRLIDRAAAPSIIGWIIGYEELLPPGWIQISNALSSGEPELQLAIGDYIRGGFKRDSWKFINEIVSSQWTGEEIALSAINLPFRPDVWDWVSQHGEGAERAYWQSCHAYMLNPTRPELDRAIDSLLRAHRPYTAVAVLRHAMREIEPIPSSYIADVLERAFTTEAMCAPRDQHTRYDVQEIVKTLQSDAAFDRERLAAIEWALLPILDSAFHGVRPLTLIRALDESPDMFVGLLRLAYPQRPNDDELQLSETDKQKASNAHRLIEELSHPIGGAESISNFVAWFATARNAANDVNLLEIFEATLGRILGRYIRETHFDPLRLVELAKSIVPFDSEPLCSGIVNGICNSRGVTSRGPFDGGSLERQEADTFRRLEALIRPFSRGLADAFHGLAAMYVAEAQREDEEAQRNRLGRY
jgi:hypothetical protein